MKIYTGYFGRLDEYLEAGLTPVSIAGASPCWYEGREWKNFAPALSTFTKYKNGEYNEFQYMEEYIPKLEKQDKAEIKQQIESVENPILLCYEKEGFCHRHLLADWLEANFSYVVEEFKLEQS